MSERVSELTATAEARGRSRALLEVAELVARLVNETKARPTWGGYQEALLDVSKGLKAIVDRTTP